MEVAFASLDDLSIEDWNDDENEIKEGYDDDDDDDDGDREGAFNPRDVVESYSRTDDTPASYHGKSTREEVIHYLEMRKELMDEGDGNGERLTTDEGDTRKAGEERGDTMDDNDVPLLYSSSGIDDDDDGNSSDEEDEGRRHPWKSINPILRLRGTVASGYGRGGKKLGVPTANVSFFFHFITLYLGRWSSFAFRVSIFSLPRLCCIHICRARQTKRMNLIMLVLKKNTSCRPRYFNRHWKKYPMAYTSAGPSSRIETHGGGVAMKILTSSLGWGGIRPSRRW